MQEAMYAYCPFCPGGTSKGSAWQVKEVLLTGLALIDIPAA